MTAKNYLRQIRLLDQKISKWRNDYGTVQATS